MIRVLLYLAAVAVLAFAAVWLADRPGDVVINWQGQRLETSVMVLTMVTIAIAASSVVLWSLLRALMRAPAALRRRRRERRGARGFRAVSSGLVAVGSGDARTARRFADEAGRFAPNEPLTLLLTAQAAQLSGDRGAAEKIFHDMAERSDTRLLGLHGLFIEARRRDDPAAARLVAEEAAKELAAPAWAAQAVFEGRCVTGDWIGALERLDRNLKAGLVDRIAYRRMRAVLLTARAIAAEEHDRTEARTLVLEAVKAEPTLVPAAALAGRILGEANELRRAARVVEAAWKANPHPDLADTYAHLRPGDSARERLARVQTLAQMTPGHVEGALAVARAAIDAQEFAIAREALAPLLASPTQRVAMLMSELEDRQSGDKGRAREWMARAVHARRDPAWTADGYVSERWLPVSPVSGRLDAFQWKDPLADLQPTTPLIEAARVRALVEHIAADEPAPPTAASAAVVRPTIEAKPNDPVEAGPPDAKPADANSAEAKPVDIVPVAEARPGEAKSADASPTDAHITTESASDSPRPSGAAAASAALALAAPTVGERPAIAGNGLPPAANDRGATLTRLPDDPGPDFEPRLDPEPRPGPEPRPDPESEAARGSEGWGRLRGIFKQG